MGVQAFTDAFAYVHGYDFTCDTNDIKLDAQVEAKDATTFCANGWRQVAAGLKSVQFDMSGFWQSAAVDAVDPQAFPDLGVIDRVYTVGPSDAAPADPLSILNPPFAYMFKAGKFSYEAFGEIGELTPFKLGSSGTAGPGVKRGWIIAPKGNVSATGKIGVTLDTLGFGVAAGAFLWASFHVFTAGTTITVQVQSDDNVGFTTPTTLATLGPLTAAGGTWMTPVPGLLADRYFRFNCSAITGTFSVAAAFAIGA